MFTVDEPGFPIALLAILAGLRLAVYVADRLSHTAGEGEAASVLVPDEPREAQAVTLAATPAPPTIEPLAPAPPTDDVDITHPFRAFAELLDSGMIAVLLVFFLIRPFLLQAFFIPSGSMIPTLLEGDKLLASKYVYHLRTPRRGEVVVFNAPEIALDLLHQPYDDKHPTEYVKRVIGVPGDHLHIVANVGVFLNGQRQNEPYIRDIPNYDFPFRTDGDLAVDDPRVRDQVDQNVQGPDLVIPPGYLFVMGDNRTMSHDSHVWGLLPASRVVGKAEFIFWPAQRIGFVH